MKVISCKEDMRDEAKRHRARGDRVGLVPTMGFFHDGHASLMRAARDDCGCVVVSLFVNPTQFGPGEDLEGYPRDLERDAEMAEAAGVDLLFVPGVEDMYPQHCRSCVEVEGMTSNLCGAGRPGHFRGVATVVAKLFHIIPADRAYFGLKDAQQVAVIRRMVEDLDFDIEVVACPTVREGDGLAMSSRNIYLEPEERRASTVLYRSLRTAEEMVRGGEREAGRVLAVMREVISAEQLVRLEYLEAAGWDLLQPLEVLEGEVLIALAARIGRARLIDNVIVEA